MNPVSMAVRRIETFADQFSLGFATGFIFNSGQIMSLVSNWHVFSGRHPVTNRPVHSTGRTPNRVTFHLSVMLDPDQQGQTAVDFRGQDLPLLDENGNAVWKQHRGFRAEDGSAQRVDIGVLPLEGKIADLSSFKKRVQSFEQQVLVVTKDGGKTPDGWEHGYPKIGAEVTIPGYPIGLASQGVVPVWKRGSIASEPLFNIEKNTPIILIDALTKEGMSGSPVVYFGDELTNWQGNPAPIEPASQPWLVGVYAGRRGSSEDEISMALARTWKVELLHEIFVGSGVPGDDLPNSADGPP